MKKFAGPIRALVVAFKSAKITKGVETTHTPATHQPTLAEPAALEPTKAPTKPTTAGPKKRRAGLPLSIPAGFGPVRGHIRVVTDAPLTLRDFRRAARESIRVLAHDCAARMGSW